MKRSLLIHYEKDSFAIGSTLIPVDLIVEQSEAETGWSYKLRRYCITKQRRSRKLQALLTAENTYSDPQLKGNDAVGDDGPGHINI